MSDFKTKMHQIRFSWGSTPDSTRGAYSAPPNHLARFGGPTSKGRGGEGKGRGKEGKGKGHEPVFGESLRLCRFLAPISVKCVMGITNKCVLRLRLKTAIGLSNVRRAAGKLFQTIGS